jgi:hypothetical protein
LNYRTACRPNLTGIGASSRRNLRRRPSLAGRLLKWVEKVASLLVRT